MQMLHKGNKSRTVEPTAANETSSRSHALLVVTVKQSCKPPDSEAFHRSRVIQGKLFMVDLAGSEKIRETKVKQNFFFNSRFQIIKIGSKKNLKKNLKKW